MNTAQTAAPATREYHRHQASRHAARAAMSTDKARTAYYAVQSAYHAAEALAAFPAHTPIINR